ncbi:MAG: bifunctional oligoribonuclease/PAP phosphatase NrnA [Clostridia bacterium]|nr:bifunctional oligoribonuclease/PAP phosphatase NrnA [Clostridia bacterium]
MDIKQTIIDKIEAYDRIIISRHIRPDGDAVGSTMGLKAVLQASYPNKEIYLVNQDECEYMAFLGNGTDIIDDSMYADALMIVVDTSSLNRISNDKYALAQELIKIDHHIDHTPYGDYSWVEEQRSSACEMIADLCITYSDRLILDKQSATYIFAGMVTDSGRFRYRSVSGETMRLAGSLLDYGIDTDMLYAQLYLDDYASLKYASYVYEKMQLTDNGVVHIYISIETREQFGISFEEACNVVSLLDSIKGCIVWIGFIQCDDGTVRVRLRSRFMTINQLAEKYGGGGHDCAAGATLDNQEQIIGLVEQADSMVAEYKATYSSWL